MYWYTILILSISFCMNHIAAEKITTRYQFYREHKYVSFALNDLERKVAQADFRDPEQTQKIAEEFNGVVEMLEGHAAYENEKLHVLLEKKGSDVFKHAEEDHLHYAKTIENLKLLLGKIADTSDAEERIECGYQFYLAFRKFVGENLLHLHEEETQILPELQRLYSDEELRAIEFQTYEIMTPAQLVEMLELLFPRMNPVDKQAFLKDIKDSQPEKFIEVWNQLLFKSFKKHNLPIDQYAIIGSGPLGIRNLREIHDIDIVVSPELQEKLSAKYGVVDDGEVKKIVFPEGNIEAFWEGSFYTRQKDEYAPTAAETIAQAEVIEGLPFESLDHVLYFKRIKKREKDLKDISMIEEWQKSKAKLLR